MNKGKLSGLLIVVVLLSIFAMVSSVSAQAENEVAPPTLELLATPDEGVSTSSFDYSVLPAAVQTIITDLNEGKKIDIKEVNVDLSPTDLTVNVVFYTPVTSETLTYTWFDLDQNPYTGLTDADFPDYGLNDIGAEFYMVVYNGYTDALVIDADTDYYTKVPVSWTSNSFTVVIPLSALNNDDGWMDITQLAGECGMYLVDCDTAPNQGHGTVNGPGNCTLVISQITPICPEIEAIVAVTDQYGPVAGLTASDFTVKENGNAISPITVSSLGTQKPIDVAMALDGSGSMSSTDKANVKTAANTFVNLMSTNDRGAVIGFASTVDVKQSLTSNKASLHSAINVYDQGIGSMTSLHDAIIVSVDKVKSSSNVRAVIVMTDGEDTYSNNTMMDAIDHANVYGVPVYTVGIGSVDQTVLQQIAAQTGGKYYYAPSSSDLAAIYTELSQYLQSQYLITWKTIFQNSPQTLNVEIGVVCGGSDMRTYPVCGCPDADGDGVCDADDNCPNDPGPEWNCGCPCPGGDGDVVFIMDTSGSMDDEFSTLCSMIPTIISDLQSQGISVTYQIVGITTNRDCTSDYVTNMVSYPISDHSEDWGSATEDIATKYQWRAGATKIIIPMSDEAPEDGDSCYDPGSDRDAITSAIAACNANSVIASPVMCSGQTQCGEALGQALASGTGGIMFKSSAPSSDLVSGLIALIGAGTCDNDKDGTPNGCDPCPDCHCCCGELTCDGNCVVWIDNVSTAPGSTATESIMLNVTDFGSATIELTYDPSIAEVQSVSQGDCGSPSYNIDNTLGMTKISAFVTSPPGSGPSGTLEFAEIGFKAVGYVGECSPLNLTVVKLAHTDGSSIVPSTTCDGEFCVRQPCRTCGDVNCDCKVNIVDAMFIKQYTVGNRPTPCDPCPDPYPCASSCSEKSTEVEDMSDVRQAAVRQTKDRDGVQANSGLATTDLNSGLTPSDLANALMAGGGITISNVVYSGADVAAGKFNGDTGIIGFEEGIILSSGNITNVIGPNTVDGITLDNGMPGDVDLDTLIPGYTTNDAAVLEFDFVPNSNVVTFEYVFGSEEYNEYVDTAYNDVFGFFINGVNYALIPATITPVSINNVNGGNPYGTNLTNPAYYRNNDLDDGGGSIDTELDGLTVVLSLTANVNKGQTNHIKLAIADAGDYILDSDVFIRAKSFVSHNLFLVPLTDTNPVGSSHTLTAALVDQYGNPISGETITFTVTNGPHAVLTGTGVTDANGKTTWSYTGTTVGTDTIVATGAGETSNKAYKTWEGGCVVWVDDVSTAPGSIATESIMLDVMDFGSATIELMYDPGIVHVQSVSQGGCGSPSYNIDNTIGKTTISAFVTSPPGSGPSGTLEFAEIGFEAVGNVGGCSPLNLNVVTLAHPDGNDIIPATTCDGEFCITQICRICGDVNCDCTVDIVDAMFIGQYTVGNRPTPCDQCPDPYPCASGGDGGPLSG